MLKGVKRFTILFLILCILFSSISFSVIAQETSEHWASETLQKWLSLNLLKGDANGIRPDDSITRAEFVTFVNRIFNFKKGTSKNFSDVSPNKWYAIEISKAYNAGILEGDENGNMNPESPIIRQEAAAILTRVFKLKAQNKKAFEDFNDSNKVATWAQEAVSAMKEKGYIKGRGNNNFAPTDKITRAESVVMINNAMGRLISETGTYSEDNGGNVVVNVKDVVLEDMKIGESLYLTPGIGEGDVSIKNVEIAGDIYVDGGGENSIRLENSIVNGTLIVNKSKVRVVIGGSTMGKVEITEKGTDAVIIVEESSKVSNIIINGAASVEGKGKIEKVEINVNGVTISRKPDKVILGEGLTSKIGGIEVMGGSNGEVIYPQDPVQPANPVEPTEPDDGYINIVKGGKTSYTIAIPNEASEVEETAAGELQQYVEKATGVKLDIVKESTAGIKAIMIGATNFAKNNNVVVDGYDSWEGEESWLIKGFKDKLVLTGGKTRGVLYSVYHFLEDIVGVRWWSHYEEDVPTLETIIVSEEIELSGKPAFEYRDIYDLHSKDLYAVDGWYSYFDQKDDSLFLVRNRMNGDYTYTPAEYGGVRYFGPPYFVHTFNRYFPPSEYFEDNKEWYALNSDGVTHNPNGQLCMTNEGLKQAFLTKLLKNIKDSYAAADAAGHPRPSYFAIDQNDDEGGCQCSNCKASVQTSGHSGHLLKFVNWLADGIATDYPEIKLTTLAYWFYVDVPKDDTKPSDNVIIRLADNYMDILHDVDHVNNNKIKNRISAWSNICTNDNLYIWKYEVNFSINPVFPVMFTYGADFKEYYNKGVKGVFVENEGSIATDMHDMKQWVIAKLMEDPNQDVEALIEAFCDGYYGAAGGKVLEFLHLADTDARNSSMSVQYGTEIFNSNWVSLNTALEGNRLFDEALELVGENDILSARVRLARSGLDKTIAKRFNDFKRAADNAGITGERFTLDKAESALRVVACLNEQLALKCHETGAHSTHNYSCDQAYNQIEVFEKLAQDVDVESPLPAELEGIDRRNVYDIKANGLFDSFWNPGAQNDNGFFVVEDEASLTGKAMKMDYDFMKATANLPHPSEYYYVDDSGEKPLPFFIISNTGNRFLNLNRSDLISDGQYHLYSIKNVVGTTADSHSILYLFRSWVNSFNLSSIYNIIPNTEYDIYLSMKTTGEVYNGSSEDENAVYIDRILIVAVGENPEEVPLPDELKDIPSNKIYDLIYSTFLSYPQYFGGTEKIADDNSLVGHAVKITPNTFFHAEIPKLKEMHYITDENPFLVGLTDQSSNNQLTFMTLTPDLITSNDGEYHLYKAADVDLLGKPYEYMFFFGSMMVQNWNINSTVGHLRGNLFDVYISMKFEGDITGSDPEDPSAIYIDRLIIVDKGPKPVG